MARSPEAVRFANELRELFPVGATFTTQERKWKLTRLHRQFPLLARSRPKGKREVETYVSMKRTTENRKLPDGTVTLTNVMKVVDHSPLPFRPTYRFACVATWD